MKRKSLIIEIGLLLLLSVGLGGYFYYLKLPPEQIRLPLVQGCPLHLQACSTELPGGGKIFFEISPRQPNPAEPLQLKATFQQVDPQLVRVSFEGVDMYMGYLEFDLERKEKTAGRTEFSGEGGLFVCATGLMKWVVLVSVQLNRKVYQVPFEFESVFGPS